ncbi:MAG: sugar phosphate isomerase/epimerase [Clostridia bacterium]|nr:sugar phosphate isomerase/epimerase [Clostridia bacterium]
MHIRIAFCKKLVYNYAVNHTYAAASDRRILNDAKELDIMRLGRIQNNYTAQGFDLVKNSGLDFIEICCNNAEDADRLIAAKDSVKAEIARTGLDVSSVGRWNHSVLENGTINLEKAAQYLTLLDTAVELGAKTFVCGCNYDESISLWRNYCNALEFLGTLTERAKGKGIKVAIQNCNWNNFIVSPEHWKIVLGENPDLYIKFDPSHTYNRGDDYLAELSDWCERVAHVHIKGTTHAGKRAVDDPPAGMDDILWRPLFSILYARKYTGDLSIEPHSATWRGELGDAGVAFTRDFIRTFML